MGTIAWHKSTYSDDGANCVQARRALLVRMFATPRTVRPGI